LRRTDVKGAVFPKVHVRIVASQNPPIRLLVLLIELYGERVEGRLPGGHCGQLRALQISTYTKIFLYPTLEFAQCRMLWDDDLLRHGSRHKNGLRAASTEAGVQRRCDSSKG
jgi:hypothetical protein